MLSIYEKLDRISHNIINQNNQRVLHTFYNTYYDFFTMPLDQWLKLENPETIRRTWCYMREDNPKKYSSNDILQQQREQSRIRMISSLEYMQEPRVEVGRSS